MSDSINYDADNGSPLDGELNTPMPATQLFRGDGNNSTQQITAPSINTVTPRGRSSSTPPGLAAFKKCQTTNPQHSDMAVSLLLIVKESGVCCLPKGSRCTNQWNDSMGPKSTMANETGTAYFGLTPRGLAPILLLPSSSLWSSPSSKNLIRHLRLGRIKVMQQRWRSSLMS
eukprot:scaffold136912_cov74-Cyclotella_meneghiniana.AAC.2